MRMWGIDPSLMCDRHLLGEHVEMHMFVGHLNKGRNLGKYLDGLVERDKIVHRHEDLATEMGRRGMNHKSPLPHFDAKPEGYIDINDNILDLANRCPRCRVKLKSKDK